MRMYNVDLPTEFFQKFVPYFFKHRSSGLVKEMRDTANNWTIFVDESIIKHADVDAYRAFKDVIKFLPGEGIKSIDISDNAMLDVMVSTVVNDDSFAYEYKQDPKFPDDSEKQIKVQKSFRDIAQLHDDGETYYIETNSLNIDQFLALYDHAMTANFS